MFHIARYLMKMRYIYHLGEVLGLLNEIVIFAQSTIHCIVYMLSATLLRSLIQFRLTEISTGHKITEMTNMIYRLSSHKPDK